MWRAIPARPATIEGLPDKGGCGPTWLSQLETSKKVPRKVKGGRLECPRPPEWRYSPAPQNPPGW